MASRIRLFVTILVLLAGVQTAVWAQEEPSTPPSRLFITGSDATSPPSIELQAYGLDSQGNPIDFSADGVILEQNGAITGYDTVGPAEVGTLTVFLLDIPGGVAEQLPAIENAIKEYATAAYMREGVDHVAIYKIGENGPVELLAPTPFYNAVQNAFASPLEPETGATALVDSTMDMLDMIEGLKPDPALASALVVMSDGTDVVSSRFTTTDVAPHAADLGIPLHTVWLNNVELPGLSIGRDYLTDVAAGARGVAVQLQNPADLAQIWNRIASFRDQARLRFDMADPAGGSFNVVLSLVDNPEVTADTAIEVSGSVPSVTIDLPLESRIISLPDLESPVNLRFAATVSWLDGVERQVEAAQLVVNGTVVQDIPVANLNDFSAEIDNLVYGDNTIQVALLDEQGIPVSSPPVNLTVEEGSREVPPALDAGGGLGGVVQTVIWVVLLLALVLAAVYLIRRYDLLARVKMPRRSRGRSETAVATYEEPISPTPAAPASETSAVVHATAPIAYLEVLDSVTRMPGQLELKASQVSLGRSPAQADIAFENDITVSRIHATLHLEGSHFRIYDERSTSGTWVNEQQVPEYGIQLMDGDEIHLGAVHLRYREA